MEKSKHTDFEPLDSLTFKGWTMDHKFCAQDGLIWNFSLEVILEN
jgi:hypothetical protein